MRTRLTKPMLAGLDRLAAARHLDRSDLLREAIIQKLEHDGIDPSTGDPVAVPATQEVA